MIEIIDVTGGRWEIHPDDQDAIMQGEGKKFWRVRSEGLSHEKAEKFGYYWHLRNSAIVAWRRDNDE